MCVWGAFLFGGFGVFFCVVLFLGHLLAPDELNIKILGLAFRRRSHFIAFVRRPASEAYAFKGTKEYSAQQVAYQLGFAVRNDPRGFRTPYGGIFNLP